MDAKEYLRKVDLICALHDSKGCNMEACPLHAFKCGLPSEPDMQDEVIRFVEAFREPPAPYLCPRCQNEEHPTGARFCMICGLEIKEQLEVAQ